MDTEMKSRIHHRPAKPKAWGTERTAKEPFQLRNSRKACQAEGMGAKAGTGTADLTTNYTNYTKMKSRIHHEGTEMHNLRRQGDGGQGGDGGSTWAHLRFGARSVKQGRRMPECGSPGGFALPARSQTDEGRARRPCRAELLPSFDTANAPNRRCAR